MNKRLFYVATAKFGTFDKRLIVEVLGYRRYLVRDDDRTPDQIERDALAKGTDVRYCNDNLTMPSYHWSEGRAACLARIRRDYKFENEFDVDLEFVLKVIQWKETNG